MEEIIIQQIKSNYLVFFKDPRTISLVSRVNPESVKEILKMFYEFKYFLMFKIL